MKSEDCKEQLKEVLEKSLDNVDTLYFCMKRELEKEVLCNKEKTNKIDEETNEIYEKLNIKVCENLIKSKLPLRIKLFNKVVWRGHAVHGVGEIEIHFSFNNDTYDSFKYVFDIREIKRLLKISKE